MFFLYKKYSILNLLRKYVLKHVKRVLKKDTKRSVRISQNTFK